MLAEILKEKKKASLLAAALKERDHQKAEKSQLPSGGKPRNPLARDQCAYGKEKGHCKNERPTQAKPRGPVAARRSPTGKGSLAWQEQTQTDKDQALSLLAPTSPQSE